MSESIILIVFITKHKNSAFIAEGELMDNKTLNNASLQELGRFFKTDKSGSHDYLNFYEQYFSKFKNEKITLIEIGIFEGASIKMWNAYFPQATVVGVDIKKKENVYNDKTVILQSDASDCCVLHDILCKYKPTIFIDDGSHRYSHQISTFETAFLFMEPGGIFVCEDIQTSFGPYREKHYNDQKCDAVTYFAQLAALAVSSGDDRHPLLEDVVTKRQKDIAKRIEYIVFRRDCVLIKKKDC